MKYAIVEAGGKQFRAVEGGTLEVDRLPVETGENFKLEQVLLLADGESFTVGTPLVKDNPVWVKVLEHFKGPKVTIFNYSPKKRIRVKTGHRQNYTRLLVEQIGGATLVKKAPAKVEPADEAKAEKQGRIRRAAKPAPKAETAAAPKTETKAEKPVAAAASKKAAAKAEPKTAKKPAEKKPATKAPAATSSPKGKKPASKPAATSKGKSSSKATSSTKAKKPAEK
jgi:large subunit ribosomal protein L21